MPLKSHKMQKREKTETRSSQVTLLSFMYIQSIGSQNVVLNITYNNIKTKTEWSYEDKGVAYDYIKVLYVHPNVNM